MISAHRKAIDRIDEQIVKLLNERTRQIQSIGAIKLKAGAEIYAPQRERDVLDRVCRLNKQQKGLIKNDSLKAIYREVMSSALVLEKRLIIAYLGPEATFTHEAAIRQFGSSLNYAPQKTIADVFSEVSRKRADYGVVPVENSTEGAVTHTLDMFVDSELKVVGQIVSPIHQHLMSRFPRKQIKKLFVHPQSYGQCRNFVQTHFPDVEILETSSNSRSAEMACVEKNSAAIAGGLAAERYKLPILEREIQDNSTNTTRFLVLGRKCGPPTGNDRSSLMFSVADKVGALHHALATFRKYGINMTKIESRPSKRKAWEYYFFVDIEGHQEEKVVARMLKDLKTKCRELKVFGSFPNTEIQDTGITRWQGD
jgi:chorismate mutase / prephenate dehydratase